MIDETALNQRVQFCVSRDGTQIAYARVGKGPPIFKAPNWLNHIEYEWRSPSWGPVMAALARNHELVRFDQRGNGLSDWDVEDISEDAMIADMEATVTAAVGVAVPEMPAALSTDVDEFPRFTNSESLDW